MSWFKRSKNADFNDDQQEKEAQAVDDAKEAIKQMVSDEDESLDFSLRTILGGDIFASRHFRNMVGYILFVVVLAVIYVSRRYHYQKEMIVATQLNDTLLDRSYKSLTLTSLLKEKTRRSEVQRHLTDTTLKTSTTPIYSLEVEKEDTVAERR